MERHPAVIDPAMLCSVFVVILVDAMPQSQANSKRALADGHCHCEEVFFWRAEKDALT